MKTGGAVMVTGSHNPPDYNGFKMMLAGKPFFGAQIQRDRPHGRRPATWWRKPPAARAIGRCLGGLHRPPGEGLGRRRPGAERGLGQRQRRRRRGAAAAGRSGCRASTPSCFPRSTARFPNHHPDPTVPKNLASPDRGGAASAAPTSASRSTATPTASAWWTTPATMMFGDQLLVVLARDVLKHASGGDDHRRREGQPGAVRRDRQAPAASR